MKSGLLLVLLLSLAGCAKPKNSPPAAPYFREVAASAGLVYQWTPPQKTPLNLRETIGNGAAFLDFDADGSLDILLVGAPCALFRGEGKGKWTPVEFPKLTGEFLGCAVGDYDSDGFPDLYLSAYQGGVLLHNEGGKAFRDVTKESGLKPQPWGTSVAWVETVPGSGRLDLMIANYVDFDPKHGARPLCDFRDAKGATVLAACGPKEYEPLPAALFRNLGNGRFEDASVSSGARSLTHGRGLGVAACDFDGSGRLAIAFANDEAPGDLLVPEKGRFTNQADALGIAYDRDARLHAGMGLDWGDYDNDGWPDLVVAAFRYEPNSLYRSDVGKSFSDQSYPAGLGAATEPYVTFGCRFFDYDNDGWLDLAFTNGHVQDNVEQLDAKTHYRQPSQLFHNQNGRFTESSAQGGSAFQTPLVGRGLAVGDYDNDGALDLLLVDSAGKPLLLHNEAPARGHWLGLQLRGKKSNAMGYGATVALTVGGKTLVRHCHADGSYLSSSDPRVHFGLGVATKIDKLEVRWPSGKKQIVSALEPDRYHTITEER
jgi:enediyne biosynthesis protein E4